MKKLIFTMFVLVLILQANAQSSLRELIRGKTGITQHLVRLDPDEQIAFNPLQAKNIFNLHPSSDLVLINKKSDNIGFTHYRYYQTYKNIPIESSMYIVNTKSGKLIGMNGSIILDFDKQTDNRMHASLSEKQAIDAAIKHVNAEKYAWQIEGMERAIKMQTGNQKATYFPNATLVWYNKGDINPRDMRLCYKVDVYAKQPLSRAYYFVDAQTGKIVGKKDRIHTSDAVGTAHTAYSGNRTIHSDYNGTNYRLRDLTKGDGVITVHGESGQRGENYTSPTADWTLTGDDIAALDAHYGVSQTYEYYFENFGRNSYDDNGTALYSYVNDPTYLDNAFWDGSSMNFNKRSTGEPGGVTGIDVCGHELTHGVTQETSGLIYSGESGAMNESFSDIFGKAVQFWSKPNDINWKLSNDMKWIIRNMANPNSQGQPDTYMGDYWDPFEEVHTNSGVGNFCFYLLVEGGSGTNDNGDDYTVKSIGLDAAGQIFYRTNTTYLSPSSNYADWRAACISAAFDLYGAESKELKQVQNAWHAVGIGSAYGECDDPDDLQATGITSQGASLTWSNIGAISYKLQWKKSSVSTWHTVSGITTNHYNLSGLNPNTSYDFRVKANCSGGISSPYSSVQSFTTAATGVYCSSNGEEQGFEYIDKVALNGVSNQSGDDGGYGNYLSVNIPLTAGNNYKIKLTPGFVSSSYTENWTVYIDYNDNGFFDDAGEIAGTGSSDGVVNVNFTVPASATNGVTRMRVQMAFSESITDPCATFTYGEVEDYKITISGGSGVSADKVIAANTQDSKNAVVTVSPNPVSGSSATVSYKLVKAGNVSIKLVDMYGRTMQNINLGNQTAGAHTYRLTNLSKGGGINYFVNVEQNNTLIGRTTLVIAQ